VQRLAKYSCLAMLSALASLAGCAGDSPDPDGVAAFARDIQSFSTEQVLGFEAIDAWQGSGIVGPSSAHSEGATSLAVRPFAFSVYRSAAFALGGMPRTIQLDLQMPAALPGRFWLGAVQLYIDCTAANVYSAYVGQVELNGRPRGQFSTLEFAVPPHVQAALSSGCSAAQLSIAINVLGAPGIYLLDNLRIVTDLILHYASAVAVPRWLNVHHTYDAQNAGHSDTADLRADVARRRADQRRAASLA
jgi:hypothetical protein